MKNEHSGVTYVRGDSISAAGTGTYVFCTSWVLQFMDTLHRKTQSLSANGWPALNPSEIPGASTE